MKSLINTLHERKVLGKIFHTLDYCLQNELSDCISVLDLGCGPNSPIKNCKNIKYSVGVDAFEEYITQSKQKEIHTEYIQNTIENLVFEDKSFDAVIMIDVLEHLTPEVGKEVIEKAKHWARNKVIINSPNGFIHQAELDNNPYQKHLSGWTVKELRQFGFKIRGLAGLRSLRKGKDYEDGMDDDLTVSIRYKPKLLWFALATVSQLFTYNFPQYAFELFCVHKVTDA